MAELSRSTRLVVVLAGVLIVLAVLYSPSRAFGKGILALLGWVGVILYVVELRKLGNSSSTPPPGPESTKQPLDRRLIVRRRNSLWLASGSLLLAVLNTILLIGESGLYPLTETSAEMIEGVSSLCLLLLMMAQATREWREA